MPTRANPASEPPSIALINNAWTPYRLHLHRRLNSEIPGVRFWNLLTHGVSNSAWKTHATEELRPVEFGAGETSAVKMTPRTLLGEWRKGGRIIRWLREHEIKAVVLGGYADPGRLRILRWCAAQRIPCLLFGDSNVNADVSSGIRRFMKTRLLSRVIRQASAVLCCGHLGEAYFRKYSAEPGRIFRFPYEPDYAEIQGVSQEQIDDARQRFGLQHDRRLIIYSGRLVREKRVDLLIDAFAAISGQRPQWDLLVIGHGPERETLERQAGAKGIAGRVTWTGFLDDPQTLAALYRASDVLVLPSDREPWGVVINEAVAAGLAIVATSNGGAAVELVKHGTNGRLFPPGDGSALATALLDVTDADRCNSMRAASAEVLAAWRRSSDPVAGLRSALISCDIDAAGKA